MAKLPAHGDSTTPEDSASDIDSGPRLLPASGEAASGIPAWDEETTGFELFGIDVEHVQPKRCSLRCTIWFDFMAFLL